jgi:hypothetical protein
MPRRDHADSMKSRPSRRSVRESPRVTLSERTPDGVAPWVRRAVAHPDVDVGTPAQRLGVTHETIRLVRERWDPLMTHGTPEDVRTRIVRERQAGATLAEIADGLIADGVPTARGAELRHRKRPGPRGLTCYPAALAPLHGRRDPPRRAGR